MVEIYVGCLLVGETLDFEIAVVGNKQSILVNRIYENFYISESKKLLDRTEIYCILIMKS